MVATCTPESSWSPSHHLTELHQNRVTETSHSCFFDCEKRKPNEITRAEMVRSYQKTQAVASPSKCVFFPLWPFGVLESLTPPAQYIRCPDRCFGNGYCLASGVCDCHRGFKGENCGVVRAASLVSSCTWSRAMMCLSTICPSRSTDLAGGAVRVHELVQWARAVPARLLLVRARVVWARLRLQPLHKCDQATGLHGRGGRRQLASTPKPWLR